MENGVSRKIAFDTYWPLVRKMNECSIRNKDYECSCKGFQLIVNYYFSIISRRIIRKIFIQNFVLCSRPIILKSGLYNKATTVSLTYNIWEIQPLFTKSKWNMDEIFGLNFHLSIIVFTTILFLNTLHAGSHLQTILFIS